MTLKLETTIQCREMQPSIYLYIYLSILWSLGGFLGRTSIAQVLCPRVFENVDFFKYDIAISTVKLKLGATSS